MMPQLRTYWELLTLSQGVPEVSVEGRGESLPPEQDPGQRVPDWTLSFSCEGRPKPRTV